MDIQTLEEQHNRIVLRRFDEEDALALGLELVRLAKAEGAPVVINIRNGERTFFHAALPGSAGLNDLWARRKSNTALLFQKASLLVGLKKRAKGETVEHDGLSTADYAIHGGAVPIRVAGVGVVAVVTVSGLPEIDDHRLVIAALESFV